MLKYLAVLIFLFTSSLLSSGCENEEPTLDGFWSMRLHIQGKEIPFQLNFKPNETVDLINGPEIVSLGYDVKSGIVLIPILNFDAVLEIKQAGADLKGHWIKPNREPTFRIPISGTKIPKRLKIPKLEIPSKWKMVFDEGEQTKEAMLLFTHKEDFTFASVLTTTGDYRFLTPFKRGEKLILYGFDGVFAFYFEGEVSENVYKGTMYSGKTIQQEFKAMANEEFELPDATEATRLAGNLNDLVLPRLSGEQEPVINESNKNEVKVVQIFGSWCPNCIDELRFIKKWREQNPKKDVKFSIISFERSPNKREALKRLKKTKELYGIDYPIYIGGYTKEQTVSEVLPKLENFISFPTTLFLDKDNVIRSIHAGFTGPATGEYYEKFTRDFNGIIEKLLKEEP